MHTIIRNFAKISLITAIAGLVSFAAPAQANVVGITSLLPTDTFDWGQLGADNTVLTGPQMVTSTLGNTGTVTSAGNSFRLVTEPTSFFAGFPTGTKVLWDNGVGPDITFSLTNPVGSIGTEIQANYYGAFTAEVTAYNSLNQVLGSFSENGNTTSTPGTAIFIGLQDNIRDIAKIQFVLTSATRNPNDFAIGAIETAGISSVPLPSGLPMFTFALLSIFGTAQCCKRRKYL